MRTINIHAAKTHLSRLVEEAAQCEPFIIAKAARPLVKVVPCDAPEGVASKRMGFMRGEMEIPDDVNTIDQEEIGRMFDGEEKWASSSSIPNC